MFHATIVPLRSSCSVLSTRHPTERSCHLHFLILISKVQSAALARTELMFRATLITKSTPYAVFSSRHLIGRSHGPHLRLLRLLLQSLAFSRGLLNIGRTPFPRDRTTQLDALSNPLLRGVSRFHEVLRELRGLSLVLPPASAFLRRPVIEEYFHHGSFSGSPLESVVEILIGRNYVR